MPNARPATAPASSPSRSRPWCATAGPRIGAAAPSAGAISSPNCSPCRPSMPPGPTVYPTTCATAPPPKRFRPSSISISTTSPQSSRPVVLAVTDHDKVGNFQAALLGKIQSALTAPDRRHHGAPVQRRHEEGLSSQWYEVRSLPRPVAGYGDERGSSSLSTAYGAAAGQPRNDQRRHHRAAVLFHRDARKARSRSPSADRDRAAQGAGGPEPGGGGASPPGRAEPQVQGRAQRRLRRRPPGVRSREPEGVRHRQWAHDAQGRAGQGTAGSRCDAVAQTAPAPARMVEGGAAAGLAVSRPELDQSGDRAAAQPRRHRRQRPGWNLQARFSAYAAA